MLSINQFHIIVFMYVNIKDKVHSCTNFCNNMLIKERRFKERAFLIDLKMEKSYFIFY